ncbi:DUF2927 domain-containing protein [Falsiroseomonas sp. CW058]|uniref:DUF2927 domain-containing protein n=1 Tax=Falsiroseomonas sp. CW058 TaxID=3388664 RepID=UPI003D316F8D
MKAPRRALLAAALAAAGRDGAALGATDAASIPAAAFFNPGDAELARAFAAIALGGDAQTGSPPRDRLLRFRMPMRIALAGEDAGRYAPWVARHAADLAALTGRPVGLAEGGGANVLMVLSPDPVAALRAPGPWGVLRRVFADTAALERLLAGVTPETLAWLVPGLPADGAPEIPFGLVVVPTRDEPATIWAGIVEELSQLLGLLGDDDGVPWSIFNDHSPCIDLTGQDRWLIRLLHHPSIHPGMRRAEAEAAARAALRGMRRAAPAEGPPDAEVAANFLRIAFAGPPLARLARWEGAVRIEVVADPPALGYRRWVAWHAAQLGWMTRHSIDMARPGEPANLVVAIAADPAAALPARLDPRFDRAALAAAIRAGLPGRPCLRFTAFADAARNLPDAAVVAIGAGHQPATIWRCIVAQLSAVLGLPGRDDSVPATIFNDTLPHVDLTPQDGRFLRLLYHPSLRPGMTRREAAPVVAEAIRTVRLDR